MLGFTLLTRLDAILLDGVFSLIAWLMALLTAKVATLLRRPPNARFPLGCDALAPLINIIKGLIALAVCAFALVEAIGSLLSGGRRVEIELALVDGNPDDRKLRDFSPSPCRSA